MLELLYNICEKASEIHPFSNTNRVINPCYKEGLLQSFGDFLSVRPSVRPSQPSYAKCRHINILDYPLHFL